MGSSPTDRAALEGLLERVEAACGPDRRLDAEIACAFIHRNLRPAEPDDFGGEYGYSPGNLKVEHGFLMSDGFTRSIDAALSLVERCREDPSQIMNDAIEALSSHGWRGSWSKALPRFVVIALLRSLLRTDHHV